jgi:CubicO group peptidase (beta-lactamase class C family)
MYLQADWARFILDLPERGIPPWETPAEQRFNKKAYSYCTGGVFITGKAIESATGVRTDRFLQDNLFNFMDIKTLVWPMSPKGHAQTGGGVKITSPDLLKIGQLLLDKGRWQEKQFIPAQWIKEMKQPYVEIDPERNIKYGYLLWIYEYNINKDIVNNKTVTAWAASGNGGNYLWFVPQLDLTAVVTSTAYNQSYMHRQSQEIFEKHILPMAALAKVSLKSE